VFHVLKSRALEHCTVTTVHEHCTSGLCQYNVIFIILVRIVDVYELVESLSMYVRLVVSSWLQPSHIQPVQEK